MSEYNNSESRKDIERNKARPFNRFTLITPDGDSWGFYTLEEARRNQYIFGGTIINGLGKDKIL